MKIDRIVAIIMVLLRQRRTNAAHLAEMFSVSLRTVYRDIAVIGAAGIPVVSTPGVGGGFHIVDGYKVDKGLFTEADLVNMLVGLESVRSALEVGDIARTAARLRSCIPEERHEAIEAGARRIVIDLHPWRGGDAVYEAVKLVDRAISEGTVIGFAYTDRYGNATRRTVEPHRLILKENRWYVLCFCTDRDAFRMFKLSRMRDVSRKDVRFEARPVPDSAHAFTEMMQGRQVDIVLLVRRNALDAVLDGFAVHSVKEHMDERYRVALPFIADDMGYGMLLSFGDGCECLEPEDVRREMARRSAAIGRLYEGCDR